MSQSTAAYLHIQNLLNGQEISAVLALINQSNFVDGKATASSAAASVKNNLQIPKNGSVEAQQISSIVMTAISRNPMVQSAIMPKMMLPPIISKYERGMEYGMHVDSPLMGEEYTIRTDVGITLFLSDPSTYEGGELKILSEVGEVTYKLPLGDAIIYPTTRLHQVMPISSGVRLAAVTWMQCVVKDAKQREILHALNTALNNIQKSSNSEDYTALQQVYANLIRMWSEL
jgi:PKHD-type hydroxylase